MTIFNKLIRDEAGATAIEYGLLAALIAVAMVGTLSTVGTNLDGVFQTVDGELQTTD